MLYICKSCTCKFDPKDMVMMRQFHMQLLQGNVNLSQTLDHMRNVEYEHDSVLALDYLPSI